MSSGRALVLRGDAAHLPLADSSVDLIVTSPPYYALRSYTDGGAHYPGQIGSEPTPAAYIDALIACTQEWARVLKPGGSMFIDLGDVYDAGTTTSRRNGGDRLADGRTGASWNAGVQRATNGRRKSLMLLPERYRIAAVDRLGLICRAVIVWAKPNGLPESVTDRVRRSHEDWVHLTKAPRYYSAVDEIREPQATLGERHGIKTGGKYGPSSRNNPTPPRALDPLGKLPGSVWSIPTEPLQVPPELGVDHFAAYPTEWPRRLILGWSPPGICTTCGEGRRPTTTTPMQWRESPTIAGRTNGNRRPMSGTMLAAGSTAIVGYVCACTPHTDHPERQQPSVTPGKALGRGHQDNDTRAAQADTRHHGNDWPARQPVRDWHLDQWTPPPTRPAVVLDPFGGTGTTALVAKALGRTGISLDRSADYNRIATWRTTNPQEFAKAMRVQRPEPVAPDQLDLFQIG